MKSTKIFLFLIIQILLLIFSVSAQTSIGKIKTVVIDAGHGGTDPGAVGRKSKEKDITLAVSLKTGDYIKTNFPDVKVVYTRNSDVFVTLKGRAQKANHENADVFISIHCNSAPNASTASGVETFIMGLHKTNDNLEVAKKENAAILLEANYEDDYAGFDPTSDEDMIAMTMFQSGSMKESNNLAYKVQRQFVDRVGRKDRGVKQAGFWVLYKTTMPGILIELGFLSNASEEQFLMSEEGKTYMASAIYRAFKEYKEEFEADHQMTLIEETPKETQKDSMVIDEPTKLIYFVQIAASKTPLKLKNFKNVGTVVEKQWNGRYIYLAAQTDDVKTIRKELEKIKEVGFKDAFAVAFLGDKRMTLKEAEQLQK
ncbi:MAG: N-acetylmuramoyl-L-alanine amidase [Bacteroidales bacterium]|nr:N-acetylmuramoyl-L-alanine amidase [Bacteroidales bacterium]